MSDESQGKSQSLKDKEIMEFIGETKEKETR